MKNKIIKSSNWLVAVCFLITICQLSIINCNGQSITRAQIISNAVPYTTYTFTTTASNIKHSVSCSGVGNIITPSWVVIGNNTSMPYCWGGFSTLASFTSKLTQGKSAGDDDCTTGGDGSESCAVGVDCSGFVSRTWGRATKESTSSIPNISTALGSASMVQPGDCFNKAGSHVRLVETNYGNGNYRVIESSANGWHVAYNTYTASQLSAYVPRIYVNVTTTSSCGTPTGLTASSVTLNSVILNWTAISGATSYNLQYKASTSSTWITVTSATTSQSISGLTAATAYQYQVQAVCSSAGIYSAVSTFTTLSSSCGTPSALSVSSIASTSAMLNWGAVAGATSYNIQYKASTSSTWITITSATTSQSISGLSASTAYQFQVQAVCSSAGTYSAVSTFTTLASTSTSSTITVGNGTSVYSAHPYGTANMDERSQYIITKSELVAAGWSSTAPYLKSIAFNVTSAASQSMGSFTITIANTSASSFSSTAFLTGTNSTVVFSSATTAIAGWNTYHFSTAFAYDGTSNLLINICWNNSSFTANSSIQSFSYSNFVALYYRANMPSSGVCAQSAGTQSYYRPNSRLEFSNAPQLQLAGNNGEARSMEVPSPLSITNETTFEVFPNPFDGTVLNGKFSDAGDKQMTVHIYDMLGREVFAKEIFVEAGNFSLSLSGNNLQSGMYVFTGITNGTLHKKILVVK